MLRSDLSPLYNNDKFSDPERRLIQSSNIFSLRTAFSAYNLEPETSLHIPALNINGAVTGDAHFDIKLERSKFTTTIKFGEERLCTRSFHYGINKIHGRSNKTLPIWLLNDSRLDTSPGYEGNGFAKGLLFATEDFVPKLVATLPDKCKVIALYSDFAHGAEENGVPENGYRTGWTSEMLKNLGYTNNFETIKAALGENLTSYLEPQDSWWLKVFRE